MTETLAEPEKPAADANGERGLDDGTVEPSETTSEGSGWRLPPGSVDRFGGIGGLVLALLLLVVVRTYIYGSVFRHGDVVLLANDPYFYRYRIENVVAVASGPFDIDGLTSETKTAPLLIALMTWLSELAGGQPTVVGDVVVWMPVVAGMITGLLVYAVTVRLTGIRGAGVAAAVALGITPIHAIRTALGFVDHHAFDYVWVILALYALVVLAERHDLRSRSAWLAAGGLVVALAGQVFSWAGGVILIIPIAIYAQYRALVAVRIGASPQRENAFLTGGVAGGAALVLLGYGAFSWHQLNVALVPLLLLVGVLALFSFGEFAARTPYPTLGLLVFEGVALALGSVSILTLRPIRTLVQKGTEYFSRTVQSGVAETVPMIDEPSAVVTGPFSLFGLLLFAALPYLVLVTIRVRRERGSVWAAPLVYAWFFLVLSVLQRRFAGELAVVLTPLLGAGLVDLGSRLGVVHPIDPFGGTDRSLSLDVDVPISRVYVLAVVVGLVVTASFVPLPIKMNQVAYDADEHDAARWMRSYADEQGLEYPENYVLSPWSDSRMYNYFVSYHSVPALRYSYARSNYDPFLSSASPEATYQRHRNRVGFVVTTDAYEPSVQVLNGSRTRSLSMYARLHDRLTGRGDRVPGLAHYRALWTREDGSVKVFALVPGATITGDGTPNTTVPVSTTVSLEHRTFTYRRCAMTNETGAFAVTVPYPGEYTVGNSTVTVSEMDVARGQTVSRR